jgi:DNA-binding beta-propeller fold protein YncE
VRVVVSVLIALGTLAGCSERERLNPFDPRNPITGGHPSGFAALAGDGRVELRWDGVTGQQLIGYRLYRRTAGQTDFEPATDVLPVRNTSYVDLGRPNGVDHVYRLYYVFTTGLGPRWAEDTATPGPTRPWVADAGRGTVERLTPDGHRVAFVSGGLSTPVAVAVDTADGTVWVSDNLGGRVRILRPGGTVVTASGFSEPGAIAVQPADHSAWICDERRDLLDHRLPTGDPATLPIAPLALPLGVAVDVGDGDVLVVERNGDRVRRHDSSGGLRWSRAVEAPSRVAADPVTHEAWVTSFATGTLTRLAADGAVLDTLAGFSGPIGVAVDGRRGRVWVAEALGGRVAAVDVAGGLEFRVAGLPEVRDVAVNPETGEAWAAVTGAAEVVRLSPGGAIASRLGGFSLPYGVAVDPGPRPGGP